MSPFRRDSVYRGDGCNQAEEYISFLEQRNGRLIDQRNVAVMIAIGLVMSLIVSWMAAAPTDSSIQEPSSNAALAISEPPDASAKELSGSACLVAVDDDDHLSLIIFEPTSVAIYRRQQPIVYSGGLCSESHAETVSLYLAVCIIP